MAEDKTSEPPESTAGDAAHAVVRVGLSAIPYAGGAAAELFSAVIAPPLEKRRDQWMQDIAKGLSKLQEQIEGFTVESLVDNEEFTSAVMRAIQAAVRNHQEEKLEALRNAVLNVACGNAPDEDIQQMFLQYIDDFTPCHLRILCFLQGSRGYGEAKGDPHRSTVAAVLEHTFPELKGQEQFYGQVVKDLSAHGLLSIAELDGFMVADGVVTKRTTPWGDAFVEFITSPLE